MMRSSARIRRPVLALCRAGKPALLEAYEDVHHRLPACRQSLCHASETRAYTGSSPFRDGNSRGCSTLESPSKMEFRSYRTWTPTLVKNWPEMLATNSSRSPPLPFRLPEGRCHGRWRCFAVQTEGQAAPCSSDADGNVVGVRLEVYQVPELEQMLQEESQELSPDPIKIAMINLRLGQEYDVQGADPDKVLGFASKALTLFEEADKDSVEVGMCLHLMSAASLKMGKHDLSLSYLDRALQILETKDSSEFSTLKFAVHFLSGDVLTAKGMFDEALSKYCTGISLQETVLGLGHLHLGNTYKQLAQACAQVMQFNEAISYASKALEIHVEHLGRGTMEEAADCRLLSSLYSATEDYAKALEYQMRVRDIVKKSKHLQDDGFVDLATSDLQINLGRYDEAIALMKSAQSEMVEGSLSHSLACVNLAKAHARLNRMVEAKELCSRGVSGLSKLDDLDNESMAGVAQGYSELAAMYEMMNEPTSAIEALQKSLSLSEKVPGQVHAVAGTQAQIGMLLLFVGRVNEALPCMESAAEKLRESLGLNHHALALVLNQMGVANSELERIPVAVEHFEEAKRILLSAYGPGHDDTLAVFQNLVGAYSFLERWDKALESQEHIIKEWTKQGQESTSPFKEAVENLEWLRTMKSKVQQDTNEGMNQVVEDVRQPHQVTSAGS